MDIMVKTEKEERVAEEYLSSLTDLNCNSKPLINMLTMLAEENIEFAPVIVKVVEQHIAKVPPDFKLPLLYLIDSIIKNVKGTYVQLFSQCIVNIFCGVFEKVNEKTRERMYALRQTWNEVFSPQKLFALDVKVKRIDNNWPITAKQPQPSIHVNPNFLKTVAAGTTQAANDMEEILQAKTRELLELRKRKLELELEATKKRLEEQEKQLSKATDGLPPGIHVPSVSTPMVPGLVAPTLAPGGHIHPPAPVTIVNNSVRPGAYQHSFRAPRPQPTSMASGAPGVLPPVPSQHFPSIMGNTGKPKVHPINPSMLNIVRLRDPRLARQQQQQMQVPFASHSSSSQSRNVLPHMPEELKDGEQQSSSMMFSQSGSNKNDRNTNGNGGRSVSSGSESKSSRQLSSSGRYAGRSGKSHSSRDKEKERKSSESRSSALSASSTGSSSSSSERRKASTSSREKFSVTAKCDKDAFEIAPLSTALKRKSSSPAGSPNKVRDSKRSSKSRNGGRNRSRSRSRSPINTDDTFKTTDIRSTPLVSTSPTLNTTTTTISTDKHSTNKRRTSESDHDQGDNKSTNPTKNLENKKHSSTSVPGIASLGKDADVLSKARLLNRKLDTEIGDSREDNQSVDSQRDDVNISSETGEKRPIQLAVDINIDDGKKRHLNIAKEDEVEQPLPKKSKSTKFDALFGSEDVDLRQMPPQILNTQQRAQVRVITPPPPPVISAAKQINNSVENTKTSSKSSLSSSSDMKTSKKLSNLEDVRAKLAKSAKLNKFGKNEKSNKEIFQRSKAGDLNINEDSQEANEEKIRIIVTQAQELLESKSINNDQYKNLMQTIMSMNETNKLRQAKHREDLSNYKGKEPPFENDGTSKSKDIDYTGRREEDKIKASSEKQSTEYEQNAEKMTPHEAILKKRIPKLPKSQILANESKTSESPLSDSNSMGSPIYDDKNTNNDSSGNKGKGAKDKRLKHTKWGVERGPPANIGKGGDVVGTGAPQNQKSWMSGSSMKRGGTIGFRHHGPPSMAPIPNAGLRNPHLPWQFEAIRGHGPPPLRPPSTNMLIMPQVPTPPSIPKPCNSIDNPQADMVRSITIDGLSKEIRIYDQVAIVFMEANQPREIGFQAGQRSIIIDNEEPIVLQFNDDYKTFDINGEPHRLRFGFPSRELYIDEHWYEIYFGGPPVSIPINNRIHILKAEGPPPQVNIGSLRLDLVVGKINMVVDAHIIIPLFLDARIQMFQLGEKQHTVQFADNLLTVLLDGEPTTVEYGGLPKSYTLGGNKYFIRFCALPKGITAGSVRIRNMIYVKMEAPALQNEVEIVEPNTSASLDSASAATATDDVNSNAVINVDEQKPISVEKEGKETEIATEVVPAISAAATVSTDTLKNMNIDELFQKLVSSGILGGPTVVANSPNVKYLGAPADTKPDATETNPPIVPIIPIDLGKSESVKTRQASIVDTLFSGMQCSSCGVRFPPEQTMKYSQHLDWHFRQNRRERDSTRKAHSRKWFYDLNDWVQYEEIEDLEEREKNFFESQQGELEANDDCSNQRVSNSPIPSCAALPEDVDRACDMCHEKFEQFYNEELEEWHLRCAVRVDDKIYHPLCYEDYKAALMSTTKLVKDKEEEPTAKSESFVTVDDDNATDTVIKCKDENNKDSDTGAKISMSLDDDEDDVIVLPNEEPSITEIDDDDDEEYVPVNVTREEMGTTGDDVKAKEDGEANDATESDVEIQETPIPFTDLDMYEEKELPECDNASQMSFANVKIKEEPKDDDDEEDEDDGFEDVGTVLVVPEEEISIQSSEDTQTQTITSATSVSSPPTAERPPSTTSLNHTITAESPDHHPELNISIDGTMGVEDEHNLSTAGPAPAIPLASLVNKIKINITKNTVSTSGSSSTNNNSSSTSTITTAVAANTAAQTSASATQLSHLSTSVNSNTYVRGEAYRSSVDALSAASSIPIVSTIPVLCGGKMSTSTTTTTASTNTNIPTVISSGTADTANDGSNISNISVIGSYSSGGAVPIPRYCPAETAVITNVPRQASTPPPVEETIKFDVKPSLQTVTLKKTKKVECGIETSGLCSIM